MVKMTNHPDIYRVARNYLAKEKQSLSGNIPLIIAALIEWKGQPYVGGVQEVTPEYSKEIVLLSKSSRPISEKLRKAIAELDEGRLNLSAETILDLEGRLHVLRKIGNKLQQMTVEQINYVEEHSIAIIEQNTGDIVTHAQQIRYVSSEEMGLSRN